MNGLLCPRCGWLSVTYELASTHHLFCPALAAPSGASEGGVRSPSAPRTGRSGHPPQVGRTPVVPMSVRPARRWGAAHDGGVSPNPKT